MTLLDVLIIALARGMGEALPIGASGALTALPGLAGGAEAMKAVSIAAHLGILAALLLYFRRDVAAMGRGLWRMGKGKPDQGSRLLLLVAAGTIPTALAGLFLAERVSGLVGPVAAAGLILAGGLLLVAADRLGVTVHRIEHLGFTTAALLGTVQVLALLPGVSRTGVVITLARLMGWERADAARFSLLLAVPLLGGHAGLTLWQLGRQGELILSTDLALASLTAGLACLLSVSVMMAWVERRSFLPFALARMGLGIAALVLILAG